MESSFRSIVLVLSLSCVPKAFSLSQEIPNGPYFGQEPPGLSPEVFAPDIISLGDRYEYFICFTPNGEECCFGVTNSNWSWCELYYTQQDSTGEWSEATIAYFQNGNDGWTHFFAPDGQKFFFASGRPNFQSVNIWMCDKSVAGWSDPVKLDIPINTSYFEWRATTSIEGVLYLNSNRSGGQGDYDIYESVPVDNQYVTIENMGPTINSSSTDAAPFISPNGEYLLFESWRAGGYGQGDLYISYSTDDDSWTTPQNLGPGINTEEIEDGAYVSPEGNYMFFNRRVSWMTNIDSDIYWVDSRIVFKPYVVIPIENVTASLNEDFEYEIPVGTFEDYDDDALLYSASLSHGDPLPTWLEFDAATLTFLGNPTQPDTAEIELTATDSIGSSARDLFSIFVPDTSVAVPELEFLGGLNLSRGYPNPSNGIMEINYSIPRPMFMTVNIYNAQGGKVRSLRGGFRESGNHTIIWDGKDGQGNLVRSGAYLCAIMNGEGLKTSRILLIR